MKSIINSPINSTPIFPKYYLKKEIEDRIEIQKKGFIESFTVSHNMVMITEKEWEIITVVEESIRFLVMGITLIQTVLFLFSPLMNVAEKYPALYLILLMPILVNGFLYFLYSYIDKKSHKEIINVIRWKGKVDISPKV